MGSKRKRQAVEAPVNAPAAKKHQKNDAITEAPVPVVAISHPLFFEDPKGPHLKREVQLYEKLSSEDSGERLEAADAIVSGLLGGDGVSEPTLLRHLDRRLFRGLASGRKGARLGFSVVLAEILAQLFGSKKLAKSRYHGLTFEKLLTILSTKTKPEGDLSGQEERDHHLGQLFGVQCFVRAKVLFLSREDVQATAAWERILAMLINLAKKKPWIREECGWVIIEALPQMDQPTAEQTVHKLQEAGLATTPEGVGIWLTARRQFPDLRFPSKPWGLSGNPLDHLKDLGKALKESSSATADQNSQQAKQSGNWNPQLHFVWSLVMDEYLTDTKEAHEGVVVNFRNFWKVAVDENLFADSASQERKFWGFSLFQKMMRETVPYKTLQGEIFGPNFVRCLINHASKQDRFLHRAAVKTLKVIHEVVAADPSSIVSAIVGLLTDRGVYNFDRATKTKTFDGLLPLVDGSIATSTIELLWAQIERLPIDHDTAQIEAKRQQFGDYVLHMIRQVNLVESTKDISWIKDAALPALARLAYSDIGSTATEVSQKTRTLFQNRLASAFAHLISDLKGFVYPIDLLPTTKTDAVPMDAGISAAKDKALVAINKLVKKAEKAAEKEQKACRALALLYSLTIFQLYNGESDALSVLEELKLCYDKLVQGKNSKESDIDASEVLIEILLSISSKPSMLLRRASQQVFEAFSNQINAEGLQLMTDILQSSESLKGQQDLFDQEDELDGEDDDDDDEEDELDSDVEIVNGNVVKGNGVTGKDDSEDEDDDDDDENEDEDEEIEDDEEAQKLDAALALALGTHRADKDPQEASSDSDADMSDSEMMELDNKLVEIFSQRKKLPNKKQEKKDARENIINFKSRVLDLLEIFVKKQAANPTAFDLLLPLLTLVRTTTSKVVSTKAHGVITAFATAYRKIKASDSDDAAVSFKAFSRLELLSQIHEEASKNAAHAYAKAASTASLLIVASLYKADTKCVKKVATVYRDSMIRWVEGGAEGKDAVRFQAAFFVDWVNWCQSHAVEQK